jgi:predicted PurR-regulated permease PerM
MDDDKRNLLLRHPIAVGFALLVLFGILHSLAEAMGVLLLGFLAILLATVLSFPINLLGRVVARPVALLVTVLSVAGLFIGLGVLAAPVLSDQATRFAEQIPLALTRLSGWWADLRRTHALPDLGGASRFADEAEVLARKAVPFAMNLGSVFFTGFLLFVLALTLAYAPEDYVAGARKLVPREHEALFDETARRLGGTMRRWVSGILVEMLAMGALTAIGLALAGVEGWLLLATFTFLCTFVPYVGAIVSAIPALIVGLAESPRRFLYVLLVFVVVHLVEAYVVSPLVMRRAVLLRPGALLFWQLLAGAVFGLPGVIVATPLLACGLTAVDYLWVERRLGKGPPS